MAGKNEKPSRGYGKPSPTLLVLVVFQIGSLYAAAQSYSVTDLGTLGGTFSNALGVNNRGQVNGTSSLPGNQNTHAMFWVNGRKIDLGTLGGPNSSSAFPLNASGEVAGSAETTTPDPNGENFCGFGTHLICLPFVWTNGVMTALPTLGGNNGQAGEINNRGQVSGTAETPTPDPTCAPPKVLHFEPVLWESGRIKRQFPTVSGDPDGAAPALNDIGQAAGFSGNCQAPFLHALLWEGDIVIDLGNLGGTTNNAAQDINNHSEVVGFSNLTGDITVHAFLWQRGVMTDLGTLPEDFSSFASGINENTQVVGGSCDVSGNCRAFLWERGVMTDLNTLAPNSPLILVFGFSINDGDPPEIAGLGLDATTGEAHAYLATPVQDSESARLAPRGDTGQIPSLVLPQNARKLLQQRMRLGTPVLKRQ